MKKYKANTGKKVPSERTQKARAFCKRYWYWFVTIALLIGGVIGWCFGMGYFDKPVEIVYLNEELNLVPGGYYVLDVDIMRKDVEIHVRSGSEKVILVRENVLYAQKDGMGYVEVKNGNTITTYRINCEPLYMEWTLAPGDRVSLEEIYDVGNNLYMGAVSLYCSDFRVFERAMEEKEEDDYFEAKQEGYAWMIVSVDEVRVCNIMVTVKENLPEEEKYYSTTVEFLGEKAKKELAEGAGSRIRKEFTLPLGESYYVDDFSFSGGGNVCFLSSNEKVLVYQNGVLFANVPGTSVVTVVCASDVGMDYYSLKITVPVQDVDFYKIITGTTQGRPVYVGESVTQKELIEVANHKNIVSYESTSSSLVCVDDDPYEFEAVSSSDKEVVINAYMKTKQGAFLAIRYHLYVKNEGEEINEDDE